MKIIRSFLTMIGIQTYNTEEETEIVNIIKEDDNKVIVETKTGRNVLKSTVYIFPKDIFVSRMNL